jgi:hypothetical protein
MAIEEIALQASNELRHDPLSPWLASGTDAK